MRVAVIGAGYVGLVTGACLASAGHEVVCADSIPAKVAAINRGLPGFYEPGLTEVLESVLAGGRFRATGDAAGAVAASEATFLVVGTPPAGLGIDLSYVGAAAVEVGRALRRTAGYHVVAVKSTVVPGTTDTFVRGVLERESGMRAGEFGLCTNPEFLREGSAVDDFMEPDRVVIGQWDEASGRALAAVYAPFDCPKIFTGLNNAELIKYTSNALLATLISFSNEIASLCEAVGGTDADEVMDALHLDRRLSPVVGGRRVTPGVLSYLRAGSGFGGSCLPKDVNALRAFARGRGVDTELLDAVVGVNERRPAQLLRLAEESAGPLEGRRVAVLGLAFKAGTSDVRSSPALSMIEHLLSKNASVRAYDPKVSEDALPLLGGGVQLCETPEAALSGADMAVVCTAWPEFARWDWRALAKLMRRAVILDGRNALRGAELPEGVTYLTAGRGRPAFDKFESPF